MSIPYSNRLDGVLAAGATTGQAGIIPVITVRPPAPTDIRGLNGPFKIGQVWFDTVGQNSYFLASLTSLNGMVSANWVANGGSASGVASITGTANEITASAATGNVILSVPIPFITPGFMAATGSITSSLGDITATNGNLVISHPGSKLMIATGSNASAGIATMASGTAVVATSAVTDSSIILYSRATVSGTAGEVAIDPQTAGVGFTLVSTTAEDSTFYWLIIN